MRRLPWILGGILVLSASAKNPLYPEGYRSWHHVKSEVIFKEHRLGKYFAGIHHIYANDAAYRILRKPEKEREFPVGAMFVMDLLEVKQDKGKLEEGKRKFLLVAKKVGDAAAETGGWVFEGFLEGDPAKPAVKDPKKECFKCHKNQRKSDYIFARWRP